MVGLVQQDKFKFDCFQNSLQEVSERGFFCIVTQLQATHFVTPIHADFLTVIHHENFRRRVFLL